MSVLKYAVIAAAGYGSRLHQGIPKCLVTVNDHKIIEYQLALLRDIPNVRIVVGYCADQVIEFVKKIRPDVKCIINEYFDTTNTLQSYYLCCHDIHDFFILLDGDIIPQRTSFKKFLAEFQGENVVGVARTNTEDAVFTHLDESDRIIEFTREKPSLYEWSNIALLHSDRITNENTYVYQCIEKFLPVQAKAIERLEIDTPQDMEYALNVMRKTPAGYVL